MTEEEEDRLELEYFKSEKFKKEFGHKLYDK